MLNSWIYFIWISCKNSCW